MNFLAVHVANQIRNAIALLSCGLCGCYVQHAVRNAPHEANTQLLCPLNTHFRDFTYIRPHRSAQPELALACFHSFGWTEAPSFEEQRNSNWLCERRKHCIGRLLSCILV